MKTFYFLFAFFMGTGMYAQASLLSLERVVLGTPQPVDIAHAGDGRLFIVQQKGSIRIVSGSGELLVPPFLVVPGVQSGASEQGLLGLAFAPDYASSGHFYVNYTTGSGSGSTRVSRFKVSATDPNQADPASEKVLLEFRQPYSNHNGGGLKFGPDGYLYIATGDGGSANDPQGYGQDPNTFLGKLLRIDVNDSLYKVPTTNPFVNTAGYKPEIWATGLRNPWRISFDKMNGDLWIGDVGQNAEEEIDRIPAGQGGLNYGWDCKEGYSDFFQPSSRCSNIPGTAFTAPVTSYKVDNFCNSVTGGFVYRGCDWPELWGAYVFADYCHGRFWTIRKDTITGAYTTQVERTFANFTISSFGEDQQGELYVARHTTGEIFKLKYGTPAVAPLITQTGDSLIVANDNRYQEWVWFRNGQKVAEGTSAISISDTGSYTVAVRYHATACSLLSTPFQVTTVRSGNALAPIAFTLLPNPATHEVQLSWMQENPSDAIAQIFDSRGLLQWQGALTNGTVRIPIVQWPAGTYWVRATHQGQVSVKKLIKH